jgi:hypothetical protein
MKITWGVILTGFAGGKFIGREIDAGASILMVVILLLIIIFGLIVQRS